MKNHLYILFVSTLILTSCSDELNSSRETRKEKKKTQKVTSTEKIVYQQKNDEKINEYSNLNLEKIKLKLQYVAMKERINKLSYEQAKSAKDKLTVLKDDIIVVNDKLKELEKKLSPQNLAEAKSFHETEKQWDNPGITELSVDQITTIDGVQYKCIKLLEVCEIGIDIQHSKGVAFLSHEILPDKIQKECNYNPLSAFEFRKNRAERKKERQAKILSEKTEAEKKEQALGKAINEKMASAKAQEKKKKSLSSTSYKSKIAEFEFKPHKKTINSSSSSSGCSTRKSGG